LTLGSSRERKEGREVAEETVALCHLEHNGVEYNYGDPVPDAVVKAHPTGVGVLPPSVDDVSKMSKAELQQALLRSTGAHETEEGKSLLKEIAKGGGGK
jgi:hypothetical protein